MTEIAQPPFRSRKGALVLFGLVELGMGALLLLMLAFMALMMIVAAGQRTAGLAPMPLRQMAVTLLTYLLAGVVLIGLGVGSILQRRWARDLSLIVAWMWLVLGTTTGIFMLAMAPFLNQATHAMPPEASVIMFTCLGVVLGVFGIAIPAAMVLFYRSPNVRATCMAADPVPRWTERAPLPLLGLSLWLAFSAFCMGGMSFYAVLPLPDRIVTGVPAIAAYGVQAVLLFYLAWGLFMRSHAAWWIGLLYGLATAIYGAVVFPRVDVQKVVRAMGVAETPGMPDLGPIYHNPWFYGFLGVMWIGYVGYFLFVRRYFARENS